MKKNIIIAALALPLAISSAFAQESTAPTVKVSGFGTGALTWSNTDQAEFNRPNQVNGAGKQPRTGVDSNLGLQADVGINDWLSFTAQGLVRRDAEPEYGAELSMAFVKAKLSDEVSLRIGRTGLQAFMISDYRNVGYANNFLRAPAEVYSQMAYNNLDGVDATWQRSFGDTTVTAQVGFGRSTVKVAGDVEAKGDKIVSLNLVAEHGPFTARIGRVTGDITINNATSLAAFNGLLRTAGAGYRIPQLIAVADELEPVKKEASFNSIGLGMDWNNIVMQSEVIQRRTDSYVNDTTAWYVLGGYRFGKVLPYFIHSKLTIDGNPVDNMPKACPAGYPAACTATVAALNAGAQRVPYYGPGQGEQSTTSLGVRWDFHRSMAFKAQVDRVKPAVGSGLLVNAEPGFNKPVTVGAVAIDFVF